MTQSTFKVRIHTHLPVKADRQEPKTLVSVAATKHSRDGSIVRSCKTDDGEPGQKREYPFWEKLPNEDTESISMFDRCRF